LLRPPAPSVDRVDGPAGADRQPLRPLGRQPAGDRDQAARPPRAEGIPRRPARRARLREDRLLRGQGPTAPGPEHRRAPEADAPQRNVALAARGKLVVAAYEQTAGGNDSVFVARSTDGGRSWAAPIEVGPGQRAWWPSVAIGAGGAVWLAWSNAPRGAYVDS